ncbi:MAG: hypothetical protein KJ626_03485, partial [Verrucomicrobia bacterium]|nr:hypothetical protein [Verrucomicrobiota bacterium]
MSRLPIVDRLEVAPAGAEGPTIYSVPLKLVSGVSNVGTHLISFSLPSVQEFKSDHRNSSRTTGSSRASTPYTSAPVAILPYGPIFATKISRMYTVRLSLSMSWLGRR